MRQGVLTGLSPQCVLQKDLVKLKVSINHVTASTHASRRGLSRRAAPAFKFDLSKVTEY